MPYVNSIRVAVKCLPSLFVLAVSGCERDSGIDSVTFTWIANTTWLVEVDDMRILVDAAISRLEPPPRFDLTIPETLRWSSRAPDTLLVSRLLAALGADSGISHIVVGHGHVDHTIDLGLIAGTTGAEVIGARTVCLQAVAQGLDRERCTPVEGGEVMQLEQGLEVRIVRWSHSGDPENPRLRLIQTPMELVDVPPVDPETGGLDVSPDGGYPNGGGVRAFLFSYETSAGVIRWLISDSGNPLTFDGEMSVSPSFFEDLGLSLDNLELVNAEGTPRDWLIDALEEGNISSVDLWLGYGSSGHVRQVHEYLGVTTFIPHHWGGYGGDYFAGVPRPYSNDALQQYADSSGILLKTQTQYLDRFRLTVDGIERDPNTDMKALLGLPPAPEAR